MKTNYIQDLKALGSSDRFESVFLVQSKEVRQKKSGDPFLSMRLADRTGSLDAKMWDNVASVAHSFAADDFIKIRGKVQVYHDQHQIIVHKLRAIPEDSVDLDDFVPHTVHDIETMYANLLATIESFENDHLKRLMSSIFRDPDVASRYKRAPAAKRMHHARIGGLLEHVSSLLELANLVAGHYDDIDRDLLSSGVLLHDLGKILELEAGRSFEYTDEGRLLGHIALGSAWLDKRCNCIEGFPPKLKALLLHMILSHHGKLEFGSPQLPLFPEALALHYIDDLDSKLEIMRAARSEMVAGTVWSQYSPGLERFVLDKEAFLHDGSAPHTAGPAPSAGTPSRPENSRAANPQGPRKAPSAGLPHGSEASESQAIREPASRRRPASAPQPAAKPPSRRPTVQHPREVPALAPVAPRPSVVPPQDSPPLPMQPTLVGLEPELGDSFE